MPSNDLIVLQILSYIAQIISPILVVLTILVSILIYIGQKKKDRKENSIYIGHDLEKLIEKMSYIHMVLEETDKTTYEICKNKNQNLLIEFTYSEYRKVYANNEQINANKLFVPNYDMETEHGLDFEVLKRARDRYHYLFPSSVEIGDPNKLHDVLEHEFHRMIFSVMNQWTTYCISITEKVAFEDMIYKSMGGNFVEFMTICYPFIANLNKENCGVRKKMKYIIRIYNKWKVKIEKDKNKPLKKLFGGNCLK